MVLLIRCAVPPEPQGGAPYSTAPVFSFSGLPNKGKEASYLAELAERAQGRSLVEGSFLEALVDGRYLYIYLDTSYRTPSFRVGDNIVIMRGKDTMRFLSMYHDFYGLVVGSSVDEYKRDEALALGHPLYSCKGAWLCLSLLCGKDKDQQIFEE